MQSNDTKELFLKLEEVTREVQAAIESDEHQDIEALLSTHQDIMSRLMSEKPFGPEMKPVVEQVEKQVQSLISTVQAMQSDIKKHLSAMNNKKLIKSAYHV